MEEQVKVEIYTLLPNIEGGHKVYPVYEEEGFGRKDAGRILNEAAFSGIRYGDIYYVHPRKNDSDDWRESIPIYPSDDAYARVAQAIAEHVLSSGREIDEKIIIVVIF